MDEVADFFHFDPRSAEYFEAMKYEDGTLSNKKSNLRALITAASAYEGRKVSISELKMNHILKLANAMNDAEYTATTIQSRCNNVQGDLVGGGIGAFKEGNAMEMKRMDQMQRRLREIARKSEIRKAQILFSNKTNKLEPGNRLRLALWCLSGFRAISWKSLQSISTKKDSPLILRAGKSKVLSWALPCCAAIGCNCQEEGVTDLCPTHALEGEDITPDDLIFDSDELVKSAGGTTHSVRRTMSFWYRYILENAKDLASRKMLDSAAFGKVLKAINLCMGWSHTSDMLRTQYSTDYYAQDPDQVFDLFTGALNNVNISLKILGAGENSNELFVLDNNTCQEVLENGEFDPH